MDIQSKTSSAVNKSLLDYRQGAASCSGGFETELCQHATKSIDTTWTKKADASSSKTPLGPACSTTVMVHH